MLFTRVLVSYEHLLSETAYSGVPFCSSLVCIFCLDASPVLPNLTSSVHREERAGVKWTLKGVASGPGG